MQRGGMPSMPQAKKRKGKGKGKGNFRF